MFRKNTSHAQENLFSMSDLLSPKLAKELRESEEYKFYELIFCNIKEEDFAELYSEKDSRPNAPINCMVSALLYQNKRMLSYDQLRNQIKFNLLVRTAIGLQTLDEIPFSITTLFNFQNRVISHYVKTGNNLFEKSFDHLTEGQLEELKIKADIQRSDSLQAASNIRKYTRLQLLTEMLVRIWRILSDEDKERYEKLFERYTRKTSGQYIYKLRPDEIEGELEEISKVYYEISEKILPAYRDKEIFRVFERVYAENFRITSEKIEVRPSSEMTSNVLQSPDDLKATYREKQGKEYRGQTINVFETCNPENVVDLLTDISVHANNVEDSTAISKRFDKLKEKTPEIEEIHIDGAFTSVDNDKICERLKIIQVQSAIKGTAAEVPMKIEPDGEDGYYVSCPCQRVHAELAKKRYKAEFSLEVCSKCPLAEKCKTLKFKEVRTHYFTKENYLRQLRIANRELIPVERRTLRSNVEATVYEFIRKMINKKLKVRGAVKTEIFAFITGININFGRIYRYLVKQDIKCEYA